MKPTIIGYIVISDSVMVQDPNDKCLYFGDGATMFTDRRTAQRAIDRTRADRIEFNNQYPNLRGKQWEDQFKAMKIARVYAA